MEQLVRPNMIKRKQGMMQVCRLIEAGSRVVRTAIQTLSVVKIAKLCYVWGFVDLSS